MKGIKTLRGFASALIAFGVVALVAGVIIGVAVWSEAENAGLGIGLIVGAIVLFLSLELTAYQAMVIGNLAERMDECWGRSMEASAAAAVGSGAQPVVPEAKPASAIEPETVKVPIQQGSIKGGQIGFTLQDDGVTVVFSDGKQGKLHANLHGTYYVREGSQIRNYKNIAEAMASVYYYAN